MTDELHATPGPWTATEGSLYSGPNAGASVWGPDGDLVAAVFGNLAEEGDAFCTAKLMVAARQMATLAQELATALAGMGNPCHGCRATCVRLPDNFCECKQHWDTALAHAKDAGLEAP